MRISDDRYARDRLRYDLAVRFIQHRARTHTIRLWTGLTDDRIRKLYRTYLNPSAAQMKRQRGKSPQQASFFMRSHQRKYETGALAAFLCIFGVLPPCPGTRRRTHCSKRHARPVAMQCL